MPAGMPYFAWIDPSETTFTSAHMRWDEQVFSFKLSQDEGDPANLTAVVRRPRNASGDPIGLLGPGRKIWAWFAFDCGPDLIRFRGRLVGVPTSIFEELVTLEFVAKPIDLVAQKAALANTLRVLPFYDEAMIDPARRDDPDLVLEAYTAIWHYNRETHVITISDEITGEDGTVSFDCADGDVLFDGLSLTLTSGPLARVDITAEFTWTQLASGNADLSPYVTGPALFPGSPYGMISSYTLSAADWPKVGASIGDGWEVTAASAVDQFDLAPHTITETRSLTVQSPDGSVNASTATETTTRVGVSGIELPIVVNSDKWSAHYAKDGDGLLYASSYERDFSLTKSIIAEQTFSASLTAGYKAQRPCTEIVSLTLLANVQPILTDPEDGEALRLDDIRSVNLTEGGQIGNPGRRSYVATSRGNQSIQYLIALARAHLMKRARVVEIAFAPKLARMCEITLRKSAFLTEPRVGQALGKIIGYSLALDGSDGKVNCEVRIGCAIGYGGIITAVEGSPTYCNIDYVGADYQQFINRTILLFGNSVSYEPVNAAPNDDGFEFLGSGLSGIALFEEPPTVEYGPDEQEAALSGIPGITSGIYLGHDPTQTEGRISARDEYVKNLTKQLETRLSFKLTSVNGEFSTPYTVAVSNLEIPQGYNLEST